MGVTTWGSGGGSPSRRGQRGFGGGAPNAAAIFQFFFIKIKHFYAYFGLKTAEHCYSFSKNKKKITHVGLTFCFKTFFK